MANFIRKAIKHPGAVKRAAKEHGRSTAEEARVEAHSSNKHIRARGILGERLISGKLRGKVRGGKKRHGRRGARS